MSDMNEILANTIKGAVIASMASVKDDILEKLVDQILTREVADHGGEPTSWSNSDDNMKFIDYLIKDGIESIVKDAVQDYISEHKKSITEAVQDKLKQKGGFVDNITADVGKVLECEWRLNVCLNYDREEEGV